MGYVRELRALVGHRPLIIAGAAILILNREDKLLLQRRLDNQRWGLIGGSMEIGESLEETARREAFEEAGLTLNELEWFELFSGQELIYQLPHGDVVVNVTAVYTCKSYSGQLKPDKSEVSELHFFELDNLPQNLSPPDRPVIESFMSFHGSSNRAIARS